jgi:integrase
MGEVLSRLALQLQAARRTGPSVQSRQHFNRHIESKTEAEELAVDLRKQIRAGKFGQAAPREGMTLRQLADVYLERYAQVEHPDTIDDFRSMLNVICRTEVSRPAGSALPFGSWRLQDIVTDTIERFREARRAKTGVGGTNRSLSRLRAVFNWSIKVGYLDATPFKRHGQTLVKLSRELSRSRRLDEGEGPALLAACNPHLRACVEAALETGMRRGEILGLRWRQIEGMRVDGSKVTWAPRAELALLAADTKTERSRRIPISGRLRGVLEMRRFDPAGTLMPPDSFVFGNALGQRVQNIKRAWENAVLRAHGEQSAFTKTCNLTVDARAALNRIDLHFHDLRREAGSRWLEGGVPLHTVKDWLGHTNIAQTSTYLAGTMKTQHDAMAAFDVRRHSLQGIATDVGSGGQERPQTATTGDEKPNKNADGRGTAIM